MTDMEEAMARVCIQEGCCGDDDDNNNNNVCSDTTICSFAKAYADKAQAILDITLEDLEY